MCHEVATDVVICGAGAAGLTLAVDLARRGVAFRLIDKIDRPFPGSRGKAIQPGYFIVTKGWLRASHRELDPARSTDMAPHYTHGRSSQVTPGQIYKLEIPLQPMAYRFRKGNRIRLEICNGDSPVTDSLFFHFYRPDKIGTDTIYHDAEHPSEIILPVLDVD